MTEWGDIPEPLYMPNDRVLLAEDINAQVVGIVWDGTGWTYRVAYWQNGEYRTVDGLLGYEMHV